MIDTTQVKTVPVHGAELHYQDQGTGEPVVFVHGSLGDYRSWSLQAPEFSNRYRVITYSRRYHYPNAWTGDGSDYSASLHADDLVALLDQLAIQRPHVISASYGSYCALVFAQQHPDRLASLVVAEPPILNWLRALEGGEELVRPFIENALIPSREAFLRDECEEGVRLFIDGVLGKKGAFDGLHPPIRQGLMDNARDMKAECISDQLFPSFGCAEASRISAPTLLLTGVKSPPFFERITQELSRCLPRSETIVLPGASHNLNSARPRNYNRAVLEFLQNRAAR